MLPELLNNLAYAESGFFKNKMLKQPHPHLYCSKKDFYGIVCLGAADVLGNTGVVRILLPLIKLNIHFFIARSRAASSLSSTLKRNVP